MSIAPERRGTSNGTRILWAIMSVIAVTVAVRLVAGLLVWFFLPLLSIAVGLAAGYAVYRTLGPDRRAVDRRHDRFIG